MATGRSIPGGPVARRALLGAAVGLLLIAPMAHAKCGALDTARLRVASTRVATASAGAASSDAAAVVSRARRRCSTAVFAYAVATQSRAQPTPVLGARARVASVDLIALADGSGAPVWRLDLQRAVALGHAMFDVRSGSSLTWSADPTTPSFDPVVQSTIVARFAQRRDQLSRAHAAAGARSFATRAHRSATSRVDVLTQLSIAQRLTRVAYVTRDDGADRAARMIVSSAYRSVAAAAGDGAWSRIDGQWSTRAQHSALITRTTSLLRFYRNARTTQVVRRLRSALTHAADVRFRSLPSGVFYPWPRDGAFDTESVSVHIDKPGTATVEIYGAADTPVRTISQTVQPGDVPFAWDGTLADGTIAAPGEYQYAFVVDDIAGHHTRTPGLQSFTVARDTTPPVVVSAAASFARDGALGPRINAAWNVTEPLSPIVRTQLRITRAGATKSITVLLATSEQEATMHRSMRLGRGVWHATFLFTDGSGNVATKDVADLVVR